MKTEIDAAEYAKSFIGVKYSWAGNTPEQGFDCSGFVCEILKAVGKLPNGQDLTAQGLFGYLKKTGNRSGLGRNSVVFYGKNLNEITHVALALDYFQIIEAGGEGRVQTDKGFVRIRPVDYRKDMLAALKI